MNVGFVLRTVRSHARNFSCREVRSSAQNFAGSSVLRQAMISTMGRFSSAFEMLEVHPRVSAQLPRPRS